MGEICGQRWQLAYWRTEVPEVAREQKAMDRARPLQVEITVGLISRQKRHTVK